MYTLCSHNGAFIYTCVCMSCRSRMIGVTGQLTCGQAVATHLCLINRYSVP